MGLLACGQTPPGVMVLTAPFTWSNESTGTVDWVLLPTVGPSAGLQASTCQRGSLVRNPVSGLYTIDFSSTQFKIERVLHAQQVFVYARQASRLAQQPTVVHSVTDELVLDD